MLLNKQCEVLIFECIKSNKVINEQFFCQEYDMSFPQTV